MFLGGGSIFFLSFVTRGFAAESCNLNDHPIWSAIFRGTCYFQPAVPTRSWTEAKSNCEKSDSRLVEILNDEINQFIYDRSPAQMTRFWIGAKETNGKMVWSSDGRPLDYTNWYPGVNGFTFDSFIAFFTGGELCVGTDLAFMNDAIQPWIEYPCDVNLEFICEKKAVVVPDEKTDKDQEMMFLPAVALPPRKTFATVDIADIQNPEIRATPVKTAFTYTSSACARICSHDNSCSFFNFNSLTGECRIFHDKDVVKLAVQSCGWALWQIVIK